MRYTNRLFYLNLILILFIQNISSQSQSLPSTIEIPDYNFIDNNKSKFIVPEKGDSTLINNFFTKYDILLKKRQGQLNILHIGGSHVQAGILTDQIRINLNNEAFSTTRGFVFPYRVAHTNNPYSYSVSYKGKWKSERNVKRTYNVQLGLGGIAVYTNDVDAEIKIDLPTTKNVVNNYHQTIKLFGYVKDGADWAVMPVIKTDAGAKRVFYPNYDYIGNSYYTFELRGNFNKFNVYFQQLDTVVHDFVLTGFVVENSEPGIVYHAIGVNGAAVHSYLGCERFQDEVDAIKPDMVVFGIGINDAVPFDFNVDTFKNNYNSLILKIKQSSPNCVFVFITNNDSYRRLKRRRYAPNTNAIKVQKAMYSLALENKGVVFDQFEIMGGLRSMRKWQEAGLAKRDKIHFTSRGYQLMGDLFYNAFVNYYLENK